MRPSVVHLLTLTVALSLAASGANAGLTDAIKSKVKAIKGEPKAKTAAAESGAIESRMSPPVTPELLDRFQAAMEIELAEREKAKKILAAYKSQEEFNKCRMDFMQSPEGLKLAERMTTFNENATAEEMQKVMTEVGAEVEKQIAAKCGPDPMSRYTRENALMRDALAKGSDAFVKDDQAYYLWKEWVLPFCKYLEELKKQPDADAKIAKIKDEGLRIPGSGKGIYYVYTASEATELLERCDELVPLIEATL
jgi:hypothetical protein